jgi:tungstate transport system substrate-binding protein
MSFEPKRNTLKALAIAAAFAVLPTLAVAQDAGTKPAPAASTAVKSIIVQSTTSTENSGLFGHILPMFTKKTGIDVRVVAVGTGQAIKNAKNGDGDVLFVHAKADEEKFVAEGFGVKRLDVMYNDFVIIGPGEDPAKIAGSKDTAAALKAIETAKAPFASRGDDSGTHKAELALWKKAAVDAKAASGQWYRETGSGMGATLNTAVGMGAYALTDRATWASFKNKGNFKIVVEGDPALFNPYGVILVNPAKHPTVKAAEGQAFVDWIVSAEGQAAIAGFKVDGAQVFFPSAAKGS